MQTIGAIVGVIFGAVVIYLLVKNIGTTSKPVSAFGQGVGGLSSIVSSLTNTK